MNFESEDNNADVLGEFAFGTGARDALRKNRFQYWLYHIAFWLRIMFSEYPKCGRGPNSLH